MSYVYKKGIKITFTMDKTTRSTEPSRLYMSVYRFIYYVLVALQ